MCKKEHEKAKKKLEMLTDLVCTKGFFLYKRLSKAAKRKKKCAIQLLVDFLFTVWKLVKCGQIKPNKTKCEGLLLSYPDLE